MNAITDQQPWHERIVSWLVRNASTNCDRPWIAQGLVWEQTSEDSQDSALVCLSEVDSSDAWLAIPLGRLPPGETKGSKVLAPDLLANAIERWRKLPSETPGADEIHQEITRFQQFLAESRTTRLSPSEAFDSWMWWLVPIGPFRVVGLLIDQFGPPPPEVIRDWEYQSIEKRSPSQYTLVSPTGWVIDLEDFVDALRNHLGINDGADAPNAVAALGIPVAQASWPKVSESRAPVEEHRPIQVAFQVATRKPPKGLAAGKSKTSLGIILAAGAAILISSLALGLFSNPTDRADPTDPTNPTDPTVALEASSLGIHEDPEVDLPTLDALDAIDGRSLADTLSRIKPMEEPMSFGNEPSAVEDQETEDVEGIEDETPPGQIESPARQEDRATRLVEERIGFEKWGTRREVRFGRGVHSKNGLCSAQLIAEEGVGEQISITPSTPQGLTGTAMAEWRLTMKDEDAELVVRLYSKPAAKWRLLVQVGARTTTGSDPVGIAPGEAAATLDRLRLHTRWLSDSLEALKSGPQLRLPGSPDPATSSRWLRNQQRETERAIRQWESITRLCDTLTGACAIQSELSIAPPESSNAVNK